MLIRILASLILVLGPGAMLIAPGHVVLAETSPAPDTTPGSEKQQPSVTPLSTHTGLPATLSPDLFSGAVRDGYVIAQTIPDVLAGLHCYCGCDRSMGHGNLLDCFVDDHAVG